MGGTLQDELFGEKDVIVFVAGLSGSGKSTFINALLETPKPLDTNPGLGPSPFNIEYRSVALPNSRLILVELPGFDRPFETDKEVLQMTVEWAQRCCRKATIKGIIYLFNISHSRFRYMDHVELTRLRSVMGNNPGPVFKRLILVTTMWTHDDRQVCEDRYEELTRNNWKQFTEKGSTIDRFIDPRDNARRIVNALIDNRETFDFQPLLELLRKSLKKSNNSSNSIVLRFLKGLFGGIFGL